MSPTTIRIPTVAVLLLVGTNVLAQGGPVMRHSERLSGGPGSGDDFLGVPPETSSDGRFTVFVSDSNDLVSGDTNGVSDVFVRDRLSGTTERVSISSTGVQGNAQSGRHEVDGIVDITPDGRYVVFQSDATNLVGGDANGLSDVFVRDRLSGTTTLVSLWTDGSQSNRRCVPGSVSDDGRYVVFASTSTNWVPNGQPQVYNIFLRDRVTNSTILVSQPEFGAQANSSSRFGLISGDGKFVTFYSSASNLVKEDDNDRTDTFLFDVEAGTIEIISRNLATNELGNADSYNSSISSDGRFVTLSSEASNLVAGDSNEMVDAFLLDRALGTLEIVSVSGAGVLGNSNSGRPSSSEDGRFVAFESYANNLIPFDQSGTLDIFVRDRLLGTTRRVNVALWYSPPNGASTSPRISRNGKHVAFASYGSNLVSGGADGYECLGAALDEIDPGEFNFAFGIHRSGNLLSVHADDNIRLEGSPGIVFSSSTHPLQIDLVFRSPYEVPTSIEIHVEAQASATSVQQTVAILNQSSQEFEILDSRPATMADSTITVSVPNAAAYVTSFGNVAVRVSYKQTGPVFAYPWRGKIDRVFARFSGG